MQALASLLPGLREVRSALLSGYAWLVVIYLITGQNVPTVDDSPFGPLADAVGPVGVAVAVSFGASLLGSFIEEAVYKPVLRIDRAYDIYAEARNQASALEQMPESVRERLARYETDADRNRAELLVRVGLVLPLAIASVFLAVDQQNALWGIGAVAAGALLWQAFVLGGRLRFTQRLANEVIARFSPEQRAAAAAEREAQLAAASEVPVKEPKADAGRTTPS
jgi:hypothetical protein